MMRMFQRWVIGGATGSREGAWFLVLVLLVGPFWFMILAEYRGRDTGQLQDTLMIIGPAVLTLWSVAHGLQKAVDSGLFK